MSSASMSAVGAAGMVDARPIRSRTVLATDLDGTFVGGSEQQRETLYAWIREHREQLVLMFVSGRGQEHMRELAEQIGLRPDYCIGDVGTSVEASDPADSALIQPVTHWLRDTWPAYAPRRIEEFMRRHPRLRPQEITGGLRKSYLYEDEPAALRAAGELRTMGFDVLMSDGRYFDVLPRGVQKGPTLLRLLRALALPAQRTLVAGDTLNDLSMFRTGLNGVAVANREPALERALRGCSNVYLSPLPGAAGVLDALHRFHHQQGAQAWLRNS
jgi:HAD superfamily hydrolase (TIGR01484 family)